MGDCVPLNFSNTRHDVGVLEQGAWHARVDVTLRAHYSGEEAGEIAGAGGIVSDPVPRLDAGE